MVAAAVEGAGLQLEGDLDCAADLDAAGALTASCSGIDSTGAAVSASYDGVADPEAETCRVRLVVTLGDRPAQSTDGIDCFDVG